MSSVTTEPLLTKEQACVYLGISAPTLDRWMRAGKIPVLRTGRIVRFSKGNLENMLSNSQTSSKNN